MSGLPATGCYHLAQGVRLTAATGGGGVVLQSDPLRGFSVNPTAFGLLEKCRQGFSVSEDLLDPPSPVMGFLDLMRQGRVVEWLPPDTPYSPFVSIIVPVFNRAAEMKVCLTSLQKLDYPSDKIEIIVVDDASTDQTPAVVKRFGVKLITLPDNQGQSAARNRGAAVAKGELIAFIDSDCIADEKWLKQLVPYFQDPRMALVGGYVDSYFTRSRLDRYEAVCSALNMGQKAVIGRGDRSVFYVPTCNLLIRKSCYAGIGGLDESLRVGEDVDLCWRLLAAGQLLTYIPKGKVYHKHPNRLIALYRRRFAYGTSESVLYKRFPKIEKRFPWQTGGMGIFLSLSAALATRSVVWAMPAILILMAETVLKRWKLKHQLDIDLGWGEVAQAVTKGHFQLAFHLTYYAVRYHFVVLLALIVTLKAWALLWLTIILVPTLVEYFKKKPRLSFPVFAFYFLAEHIFYQCGAFWGCCRQKQFRLYRISFARSGFLQNSAKRRRKPHTALQMTRDEAIG
jgi:mycofactocin system glycosyltransferase